MMCRKRALVMSVLSNQIQLDVSKIGVYHGISHGLEIMRIIICVSNRFQGTQVSDKPSCSKFKAAFFSKNCTRMWIIHFQIDFFFAFSMNGALSFMLFHTVKRTSEVPHISLNRLPLSHHRFAHSKEPAAEPQTMNLQSFSKSKNTPIPHHTI